MNYLLGDHLGSTSLVTDATGHNSIETRYKAWGETRYASGTTPTKYQYTGQYSYVSDFGLHFYNARWYDSSLGRFAQADTIIPGGIQGLDRYAYANNNPVRYTDPSGHCAVFCAVVAAAAIIATPFVLSALGVTHDVIGVDIARAVTRGGGDAVVTAGLAVQSQNPWAIVGGDAEGFAQVKEDRMVELGLGGENPYSPSVAIEAMDKQINQAIDDCKLCDTGVDRLMVAALAQNGFDSTNFKQLTKNGDGTLDWSKFLQDYGSNPSATSAKLRQSLTGLNYDTQLMLKIYMKDLRWLMDQGYDLPEEITEDDVEYVEEHFVE
jgi:RHS repeat-associated protein